MVGCDDCMVVTQHIFYNNDERVGCLNSTDNKKRPAIVADLLNIFKKYEYRDIYNTYSANQSRGFK